MDIRVNIARLLEEHDCVILPGFGGFIGNYAPARIDPVSHSFIPPSKKILFNINLKQNDGLLCNRIVTNEGVSYTDALVLVNEMVETIRYHLKNGKSFTFPEVGRLFSGKEGTLQFEQEKNSNLLPDAFGLLTFVSPPVLRNSYSRRFENVLIPQQKASDKKQKLVPRPLKWAAMLAIPISVAAIFGITQYDKLKSPAINNAGILSSVFSHFSASSLVEKKEAPARGPEVNFDFGATPSAFEEQPAANNGASSADIDIDQMMKSAQAADGLNTSGSVAPGATDQEETAILPEANDKSVNPVDENDQSREINVIMKTDHFAIIIGAFKIKDNAQKCIREARINGMNAGIYDRSRCGLYRVALSTANKQKEAEHLLSEARQAGFTEAWLLAK
jgi:cell division septation protein DedD/nucleoid DNA-binding protein